MNAFEKWASGLLDYEDIQDMIHQREYHAALVLTPEQMKERKELEKPILIIKQLELF